MFSRADLVDIYSMADPQKCSKYIVVASDALDALFVKIRLNPAATKEGTLYFQSIEGLTKGSTAAAASAKAMRIKYCRQIAFFFIRIFQTFAALTLTMLDSELPLTNPTDELPEEAGRQRRAEFIDPRSFLGVSQAAQPSQRSWFGGQQQGGRLSSAFRLPSESNYSVLNEWLMNYYIESRDTRKHLQFTNMPAIQVPQVSLYTIQVNKIENSIERTLRTPQELEKGITLFYAFKKNSIDYTMTSNLKIVKEPSTLRLTLTIEKVEPAPSGPFKSQEFSFTMNYDQYSQSWKYREARFPSATGKGIEETLKAIFETQIRAVFGVEKMPIFDVLQKYNYIQQTSIRDRPVYNIRGTNYVFEEPRNKSELLLTYRADDFTVPDKKGNLKLEIIGVSLKNENDEVEESTLGLKTYKLALDFSKARVATTPSGYEDYISLPSEAYNTLRFSEKRDGGEPEDTRYNRTIPKYLTYKAQAIISNKEDLPDGTGIQYTRRGFPVPHNSDALDPAFRVKAVWKALVKDPPVKAHCVARATQLLSVTAIRGKLDEETFSSACRTTFLYQKDGSLPTPGQPIFKTGREAASGAKTMQGEYGILALALLFFEALGEDGRPKFAEMGKYKTFLANLKFAFEKTAAPNYKTPPASLEAITEKLPPRELCERIGDARIAIPAPLAGTLQGVTRKLIDQQVAHVGQAMDLIFELFDKQAVINRRQFALNPKILTGGTPAVNAVAAKARELLLKYYTDCETTYRQGLSYIVAADAKAPLKPYGTAVVVPTTSRV